jgi:hypothetical protein
MMLSVGPETEQDSRSDCVQTVTKKRIVSKQLLKKGLHPNQKAAPAGPAAASAATQYSVGLILGMVKTTQPMG